MFSTEIRFVAGQFLDRMNEMRTWLDSRRFEPTIFRYDHIDDGVVILVEFSVEDEAAAFASQFGGTMVQPRVR
jgi:hypothetical protein